MIMQGSKNVYMLTGKNHIENTSAINSQLGKNSCHCLYYKAIFLLSWLNFSITGYRK